MGWTQPAGTCLYVIQSGVIDCNATSFTNQRRSCLIALKSIDGEWGWGLDVRWGSIKAKGSVLHPRRSMFAAAFASLQACMIASEWGRAGSWLLAKDGSRPKTTLQCLSTEWLKMEMMNHEACLQFKHRHHSLIFHLSALVRWRAREAVVQTRGFALRWTSLSSTHFNFRALSSKSNSIPGRKRKPSHTQTTTHRRTQSCKDRKQPPSRNWSKVSPATIL